MSEVPYDPDRIPTDEEVDVILRKARQIQNWEGRAGQAFVRLRRKKADASRVRAAHDRWLAKGYEEFGPNCPIDAFTGYAVWALAEGDDSEDARYLRKRDTFLKALVDVAIRAHHTYLDQIIETDRGGAYYQLEINAEAFRMGEAHNLDPAKAFECMDAAVRLYLKRAGRGVAPRRPISDDALRKFFREGMTEMTDGFAAHMREKEGVRVEAIRLGHDT